MKSRQMIRRSGVDRRSFSVHNPIVIGRRKDDRRMIERDDVIWLCMAWATASCLITWGLCHYIYQHVLG